MMSFGPLKIAARMSSSSPSQGISAARRCVDGTANPADEGEHVERGTGRDSQRRPAVHSVEGMDSRGDIREFLSSRRAKITPEQAGLPAYGHNRRVKGLRREEVA